MAVGSFFHADANICPMEDLINDMIERFHKELRSSTHQHHTDDIFCVFTQLKEKGDAVE